MKSCIAVILFLMTFATQAQNYKFGKVSMEELQQVFNPLDSSANATVLYREEHISFDLRKDEGFVQVREVHERIKIYNKEGYKWATKRIRLYDESNAKSENLEGLKGYTYNLVNGKIEDSKLKKDGTFKEEANKYWKINSFTMPNIKDGCVVEYTYKIDSPFTTIDDIEFQYTIPIEKFDLTIKTPQYFVYNKLLNPNASYMPVLDQSTRNRVETTTNKERTGWKIVSTNYSTSKLEFIEDIITSNETDIPALNDEPFVDNLDNYKAKLILELTVIKYPNQPYKSLASSWDAVTKTIYNNPEFGTQLDKSSYFEDDLDALLLDITDPFQKAMLVFEHVKSKVKWNNFYGFNSEVGVRKAYKDGAGNVADINLMLTAMLRYAGLKAHPVLVSTKNNGIPLFPTRQGFNYVICMIEDDSLNVLLDASGKHSTFNVLPTHTLNWQGRVIREDGTSDWIGLTPSVLSKDVSSLNVKINPDLSIEGKVRQQKTDYVAMGYRDKYANVSKDDIIKNIERDKGQLEITDIDIENTNNTNEPLLITYDYKLNDGIEAIGGNLYFSPMLFFASEDNPFKQETRNFPIDFMYPFSDRYMINILIPEGYAIESLPENKKVQFGDAGEFLYLAKANGSYLQLTIALDMKTSFILAQDYNNFKDFYSTVIEKQTEKVVLKKI
ncbi:MAG: DUF3857 domain-containing protein [Psychroserpens sp.]|uniref:DUF3857 domain-containing protein n=1 Tax=Psychroserpens sp. TaxID=2020870 RepID=UPI003CA42925